jgi:protein phosphatase
MVNQRPAWQTGVRYAVRTDVGLRRMNNQDAYSVGIAGSEEAWLTRGHLFLVADGMGAHAAGELASKLAADTISQTYRKLGDQAPPDALWNAVVEANAVIHARGEANAEFHGMGTTASVLALLPQGALVAHVGDSRVYRLRGNQIEQLTFDHSLVWEMMSSGGNLNLEQAPPLFPKNIITRSLGPSPTVEVDREGPFPVLEGDTFLLCSDGLSGQVNDDELGQILMSLEPEEAVDALVDLANLRGGPDNITAIVIKIVGPGAASTAVESWIAPADQRTPSRGRIAFGVMSVAALVLLLGFTLGRLWIAAGLSLLAAIVFGVLAVLARSATTTEVTQIGPTRYGRAPYRSLRCRPNREFVAQLAEIDRQLRQATIDEGWQVDWRGFEQLESRAEAAAARQDYEDAVGNYCRAISFMMRQLRSQRNRQTRAQD